MAKRRHSTLGKRLIASAKEMSAHAKGEVKLQEYEVRSAKALAAEARRQSLAASRVTTEDEAFWEKQSGDA
jgi:hypothetical protein